MLEQTHCRISFLQWCGDFFLGLLTDGVELLLSRCTFEHEELAKKRLQDKEQKLLEFQNKTKANAMKKMREDAALKTS